MHVPASGKTEKGALGEQVRFMETSQDPEDREEEKRMVSGQDHMEWEVELAVNRTMDGASSLLCSELYVGTKSPST